MSRTINLKMITSAILAIGEQLGLLIEEYNQRTCTLTGKMNQTISVHLYYKITNSQTRFRQNPNFISPDDAL